MRGEREKNIEEHLLKHTILKADAKGYMILMHGSVKNGTQRVCSVPLFIGPIVRQIVYPQAYAIFSRIGNCKIEMKYS